MKKYLVIFMAIVTIVSLASCSGFFPITSETPAASESSEPATAEPSHAASPSPTESAAAKFLAVEPSAPEVGKYLRQNTADLSPEDADLLLERLLLLQLDISADMNLRIWDEANMTALNETLGGVLDASKIPEITDETVRSGFQKVSDSLMTMVRYEETPVFEPDWAALDSMKGAFSPQAAAMVEYRNRLQGQYYDGDPYNFVLLAEDIAATEEALKITDIGFVRWQLVQLYTVQAGRLLYGPEGSFLSMFMAGDLKIISNIEKFAEQYATTSFGAICKSILLKQGEGEQAVSDFISDSLIFPPGDSRIMTEIKIDFNGAELVVPQITGIADAAVMEKVNTSVMAAAKALVKSGRDNQEVNCYISFTNDTYISFNFLYSYSIESDMGHYTESFLMLKMKTGDSVTLSDLVGKPLDAFKDQLLQSILGADTPKDLQEPVDFMIDKKDLIISVPSATSEWPDYYNVTYNGLRSFMDVSMLY